MRTIDSQTSTHLRPSPRMSCLFGLFLCLCLLLPAQLLAADTDCEALYKAEDYVKAGACFLSKAKQAKAPATRALNLRAISAYRRAGAKQTTITAARYYWERALLLIEAALKQPPCQDDARCKRMRGWQDSLRKHIKYTKLTIAVSGEAKATLKGFQTELSLSFPPSPWSKEIRPGRYRLTLRFTDGSEKSSRVRLKAGTPLRLAFKAPATAVAARPVRKAPPRRDPPANTLAPATRALDAQLFPAARRPAPRETKPETPTARTPARRDPPPRKDPPRREPPPRVAAAPTPRRPEVRTPEVRTPEVRKPEVRTPEVRTPEVRTPEVRTPEVRKPEVRREVPSARRESKTALAARVTPPETRAPSKKKGFAGLLTKWPFWLAAGGGLIAVTGAILVGAGAAQNGEADTLWQTQKSNPNVHPARAITNLKNSAGGLGAGGTTMIVVGALAAAAGSFFLFFPLKKGKKTPPASKAPPTPKTKSFSFISP